MKNRTIACWTSAMIVASAMTSGTTAAAEPTCANSQLCLFEDSYFQGWKTVIPGGVPKGQCVTLSRSANSAVNNTAVVQYGYLDSHCLGVRTLLCANGCYVPHFIRGPLRSVSG